MSNLSNKRDVISSTVYIASDTEKTYSVPNLLSYRALIMMYDSNNNGDINSHCIGLTPNIDERYVYCPVAGRSSGFHIKINSSSITLTTKIPNNTQEVYVNHLLNLIRK